MMEPHIVQYDPVTTLATVTVIDFLDTFLRLIAGLEQSFKNAFEQ